MALFNYRHIHSSLSHHLPDGFNDIHSGKIDAIIVKNVFSKNEMEKASQRAKNKKNTFIVTRYGLMIGNTILNITDENSNDNYFYSTASSRKTINEIFDTSIEKAIEQVMSSMSGNRTVVIANQGKDRIYTPLTIRFTQENKGGMTIHRGENFLSGYGFHHLNQVANTKDWVSFFMVMQNAESGGELVLYDVPETHHKKQKEDIHFDSHPHQAFFLQPGDMIMFHGGRIYHQVLDIAGKIDRITIGGFATLSKDKKSIFYWS